MDGDLNILADEPDLLVLRHSCLLRIALYLFGTVIACLAGLGVIATVAQASAAGRAFALIVLGAGAGTVLFNIGRLMFALWTTTTFRTGADRIEVRTGGLLDERVRWLDPLLVRVSITDVTRNDGSNPPAKSYEIDLLGGADDPGKRLCLGRAAADQSAHLAFRLSAMLDRMRAAATALPGP